jgi:endogenous inhibitor of DNA gyrase (YacG/DUF329 family)
MEPPDPLYVTCRGCGKPVPSGFGLTSAVYEIPAGTRHDLTCPHCGTAASYTKADFHILSQATP